MVTGLEFSFELSKTMITLDAAFELYKNRLVMPIRTPSDYVSAP